MNNGCIILKKPVFVELVQFDAKGDVVPAYMCFTGIMANIPGAGAKTVWEPLEAYKTQTTYLFSNPSEIRNALEYYARGFSGTIVGPESRYDKLHSKGTPLFPVRRFESEEEIISYLMGEFPRRIRGRFLMLSGVSMSIRIHKKTGVYQTDEIINSEIVMAQSLKICASAGLVHKPYLENLEKNLAYHEKIGWFQMPVDRYFVIKVSDEEYLNSLIGIPMNGVYKPLYAKTPENAQKFLSEKEALDFAMGCDAFMGGFLIEEVEQEAMLERIHPNMKGGRKGFVSYLSKLGLEESYPFPIYLETWTNSHN